MAHQKKLNTQEDHVLDTAAQITDTNTQLFVIVLTFSQLMTKMLTLNMAMTLVRKLRANLHLCCYACKQCCTSKSATQEIIKQFDEIGILAGELSKNTVEAVLKEHNLNIDGATLM